jgi:hypothetical protein
LTYSNVSNKDLNVSTPTNARNNLHECCMEEEVVSNSVDKTKKIFKEKGFSWPPQKKKK